MGRAKWVPLPPVSRFELVLVVKAAIAASGRSDLTFELDPEDDDAVVESSWLLTVRTATDEVDFLVTRDGWDFLREDEHGYFEDLVEMPRLSEVFRGL
ncbi:hypothetical protein SUDANB95_05559 [Actinosynnema sp. ALI-1.44]